MSRTQRKGTIVVQSWIDSRRQEKRNNVGWELYERSEQEVDESVSSQRRSVQYHTIVDQVVAEPEARGQAIRFDGPGEAQGFIRNHCCAQSHMWLQFCSSRYASWSGVLN